MRRKKPHERLFVLFVCLVGFLTSSSTTRLYRGRAPRQERLTILRAATHETELGDHDFCLSRSHYTDTDPTCRERAATAGIEPGTSSPGVARSTAELPPPPHTHERTVVVAVAAEVTKVEAIIIIVKIEEEKEEERKKGNAEEKEDRRQKLASMGRMKLTRSMRTDTVKTRRRGLGNRQNRKRERKHVCNISMRCKT